MPMQFNINIISYLFYSFNSIKYQKACSGRDEGSLTRYPSCFARAMSTLSLILRAAEPQSILARITSGIIFVGISSNFSYTYDVLSNSSSYLNRRGILRSDLSSYLKTALAISYLEEFLCCLMKTRASSSRLSS